MREAVCFVVLLTLSASCVATSDARAVEERSAPSDPFALEACTPMTFADLVAKFPPGEMTAPLGSPFTLVSRSRASCNAFTGCTPWASGNVLLQSSRAIVEPPRSGLAALVLDTTAPARISLDLLAREPSAGVLGLSWPHVPPRLRFQCGAVPIQGIADGLHCTLALEAYELEPFEFATTTEDTAYFAWDGHVCTDGTYQFVTRIDANNVDGAANRNQMAIWGRL